MTLATEIYQKHAGKKDKMSKREFRALIVEEFRKHLGLENAGTIGMYYSIVDKRVTGREFKSYNRVAERKPNRTPEEKAAAKAERDASRISRKAKRDAERAAKKVLKVAKAAPKDPDLAKLAGEAFDKITALTAKNASKKTPVAAAAKKAVAKKAPPKKAAKST